MSAAASRPVPRALASLALVLAVAALVARGLSSGVGQALESPGTSLFLDTFCALAALAALGARATAEEHGLAVNGRILAPLAAFVLLGFASALHGYERSAGLHTAFSWAALAALGLGVSDLARRPGAARALAATIVAIGICAAGLGVYQFVFEWGELQREFAETVKQYGSSMEPELLRAMRYRVADRVAQTPYTLPSHLATAIGIACPLALLALVTAVRKRKEGPLGLPVAILLSLAGATLALGAAFTKSKGATLAIFSGLGCFLWLATPRSAVRARRAFAIGGASLAALVLLWGAIGYARNPERFGIGLSLQVRLEYWRAALATGAEAPLTGAGLETFADELPVHKVARAEEARHAHQDFLELFSEEGILGPLAFAWVILALALAGRRALLEAESPDARKVPPLWRADQALPPEIAAVLGIVVGAFILLLAGDNLSRDSKPGQLFVATIAAVVFLRAVSFVLGQDESPKARMLLGAGALAGALVFVVDGLTDFPLRVHGLVASALSLALLAPILARGPEPVPERRLVSSAALAIALNALVLSGLSFSFGGMHRDAIVEAARAEYELGRSLWDQGAKSEDERAKAADPVEKALKSLEALLDAGDLRPQEIQVLVSARRTFGKIERDKRTSIIVSMYLERATAQWPRSFGLWADLADQYARAGALDGTRRAIAAWERAVSLYPTNPHLRLQLGCVLVRQCLEGARDGEPLLGPARDRAIAEIERSLEIGRVCRLERLQLSEDEVTVARAMLMSLGAAPREVVEGAVLQPK